MRGGRYTQAEIDRVLANNPITSVVGQFVLWDKRKSQPGKGDMWACCPFHGEKSPSFHADDRKGIYHCFGCGETGDAIKFIQKQTGCSFAEAVERLGGEKTIQTPEEKAAWQRQRDAQRAQQDKEKAESEARLRENARSIWRETVALPGTLGEAYFRSRGIMFPVTFPALRFHGALPWRDPDTRETLFRFPAVVAGIQDPGDNFVAIWRIYLNPDGTKNTIVPNAKMGLGAYTGGCVRLGEPVGQGNACEGIETGLGIVGITGGKPVQACLNTTGLVKFEPPPDMSSLLIWPDGDVDRIRQIKGAERKVESPGLRAAREAKERLESMDFPVAIQPVPNGGKDFLDVWVRMQKKRGIRIGETIS